MLASYKHDENRPIPQFNNGGYGYVSGNEALNRRSAWIEMPFTDWSIKNYKLGATKNYTGSINEIYKELKRKPYYGRFHLGSNVQFNSDIWLIELKKELIRVW